VLLLPEKSIFRADKALKILPTAATKTIRQQQNAQRVLNF
jgi:hypothetical protein